MERKGRLPSAFVARRSAALFPRIGDPCYRSLEDEGRATSSELSGCSRRRAAAIPTPSCGASPAVLVIAGIVALVRGSVLVGIVLIVLGLLVGRGGVSIFD